MYAKKYLAQHSYSHRYSCQLTYFIFLRMQNETRFSRTVPGSGLDVHSIVCWIQALVTLELHTLRMIMDEYSEDRARNVFEENKPTEMCRFLI